MLKIHAWVPASGLRYLTDVKRTQAKMKWFGMLRKNGVIEAKRLWRPEDCIQASRLPGVAEVFGPFEAKSFIAAQLELRLICSAVGFMVGANGKVLVPKR